MLPPVIGVLFDGFAYGMLLFLLSVGQSVTLGMMNFINLAHCAFAMLGGYVTVVLVNTYGWPFFAALPVAFVAAAAVLGISDIAGKYYVPQAGAFFIYLVMISLLMWRPTGLFGRR